MGEKDDLIEQLLLKKTLAVYIYIYIYNPYNKLGFVLHSTFTRTDKYL